MNQPRHIAEGEGPCPPLVPGSLRCYNMKYCPYAQRTLLALVHKNVTFDIVNVNLKQKPSWFTSRTPFKKVPVLERADGKTICESLLTMDYLEEQYPEPALLPADPWTKVEHKMVVELFNQVISTVHKFYYTAPNDDEAQALGAKITEGLDQLEEELVKRGTKFFGGATVGYVDLALWPWFERLPLLTGTFKITPLTEKQPKLVSWVSTMQQVPAVKAVLIPVEEHEKFIKSFIAGTPDYNFNVQQ